MKTEVRYGLYYGGFSILWVLVMYVTELNRSGAANYLNLVTMLAMVLLIVNMVNEKKSENEGFINFSTIFKGGLIIGSLGGVISSLFYFVYLKFIDVNMIEYLKQKMISDMEKQGLPDKVIDQAISQSNMFMNPNALVLTGVLGSIFVAVVISLIIAGIMKKPNPNEIA